MSIVRSMKDAMMAGGGMMAFPTNAPKQYADRQRQYFSSETKTFTQQKARYASDYVRARVQGLDPEDIYAWQTRLIRMADVVRPSAALLRRIDNYKMILFADRDIEYITPGSKIETMGSTWLVTNPENTSGSDGSGIVERCNAVWNHYDAEGNLLSEPLVVTNRRADADDSDAQVSGLITKGYFNAIAQYNGQTAQISTNTRMVLGSTAFRVTGLPADFMQEFTGDYGSVRMIEFRLRYEEPNEAIDDMENHVAEGISERSGESGVDWIMHNV